MSPVVAEPLEDSAWTTSEQEGPQSPVNKAMSLDSTPSLSSTEETFAISSRAKESGPNTFQEPVVSSSGEVFGSSCKPSELGEQPNTSHETVVSNTRTSESTVLTLTQSGLIQERPISSVQEIVSSNQTLEDNRPNVSTVETALNSELPIESNAPSELETSEGATNSESWPSTLYINSSDLTVKEEPISDEPTTGVKHATVQNTIDSGLQFDRTSQVSNSDPIESVPVTVKEEPASPQAQPHRDLQSESGTQDCSAFTDFSAGQGKEHSYSGVNNPVKVVRRTLSTTLSSTLSHGLPSWLLDDTAQESGAADPSGAIDISFGSRRDRLRALKDLKKGSSAGKDVVSENTRVPGGEGAQVESSVTTLEQGIPPESSDTFSPGVEATAQDCASTPLEIFPINVKDEPISPEPQAEAQSEYNSQDNTTLPHESGQSLDMTPTQQDSVIDIAPRQQAGSVYIDVDEPFQLTHIKPEPQSDHENWERVDVPRTVTNYFSRDVKEEERVSERLSSAREWPDDWPRSTARPWPGELNERLDAARQRPDRSRPVNPAYWDTQKRKKGPGAKKKRKRCVNYQYVCEQLKFI